MPVRKGFGPGEMGPPLDHGPLIPGDPSVGRRGLLFVCFCQQLPCQVFDPLASEASFSAAAPCQGSQRKGRIDVSFVSLPVGRVLALHLCGDTVEVPRWH